MTHSTPPWIPYTQGDPVPMGRVKLLWTQNDTSIIYLDRWTARDWQNAKAYQRHPDHQLIADMRDSLYEWLTIGRESLSEPHGFDFPLDRALILRAEAVVGRAPGLPKWLVEYLDEGAITQTAAQEPP